MTFCETDQERCYCWREIVNAVLVSGAVLSSNHSPTRTTMKRQFPPENHRLSKDVDTIDGKLWWWRLLCTTHLQYDLVNIQGLDAIPRKVHMSSVGYFGAFLALNKSRGLSLPLPLMLQHWITSTLCEYIAHHTPFQTPMNTPTSTPTLKKIKANAQAPSSLFYFAPMRRKWGINCNLWNFLFYKTLHCVFYEKTRHGIKKYLQRPFKFFSRYKIICCNTPFPFNFLVFRNVDNFVMLFICSTPVSVPFSI